MIAVSEREAQDPPFRECLHVRFPLSPTGRRSRNAEQSQESHL